MSVFRHFVPLFEEPNRSKRGETADFDNDGSAGIERDNPSPTCQSSHPLMDTHKFPESQPAAGQTPTFHVFPYSRIKPMLRNRRPNGEGQTSVTTPTPNTTTNPLPPTPKADFQRLSLHVTRNRIRIPLRIGGGVAYEEGRGWEGEGREGTGEKGHHEPTTTAPFLVVSLH